MLYYILLIVILLLFTDSCIVEFWRIDDELYTKLL
jgi:hypothetical protein